MAERAIFLSREAAEKEVALLETNLRKLSPLGRIYVAAFPAIGKGNQWLGWNVHYEVDGISAFVLEKE